MRLARAGAPDERERLAGGHLEGHVVEHLAIAVREREAAHRDRAVDLRRLGQRSVGDLGHGVEDLLEARVAGATALDDGDREAERDHRPGHAAVGEPEGEEVAARDAAVVRAAQESDAPYQKNDEHAERARRADHRAHEAAQARERRGSPRGRPGSPSSKRRRSRSSSAKLRTTRTPARFVCSTSLSLPSASWFVARAREHAPREGARRARSEAAASRTTRA